MQNRSSRSCIQCDSWKLSYLALIHSKEVLTSYSCYREFLHVSNAEKLKWIVLSFRDWFYHFVGISIEINSTLNRIWWMKEQSVAIITKQRIQISHSSLSLKRLTWNFIFQLWSKTVKANFFFLITTMKGFLFRKGVKVWYLNCVTFWVIGN